MKKNEKFDTTNKTNSDYFAYVKQNYMLELFHHTSINELRPPFSLKIQKEYKKRLNNLNYFSSVLIDYIENNFGHNCLQKYGIGEDYTIEDIPKLSPNKKYSYKFAFPFNDDLRYDMISKVKKYKLLKTNSKQKENKYYNATYYIGVYNKQYVLFREVVNYEKCNSNSNFENGSYSLSFYVKGKREGEVPLIRYDYKPKRIHINKMIGNKLNLKHKDMLSFEELQARAEELKDLKNKTICNHIHLLNKKYTILFPSYLNSCDAFDVKDDRPFNKIVESLRRSYKIQSYEPILLNYPKEKIYKTTKTFLEGLQEEESIKLGE